MKNAKLQHARRTQGWTQRELADKLGVGEKTVQSWELGTRSPSLRFRRHLCETFQQTAEQLGLTEDRELSPILQERLAHQADQNHQQIPQQVRSRWPIAILEHSFYRTILIEPVLHERPDIQEHTMRVDRAFLSFRNSGRRTIA